MNQEGEEIFDAIAKEVSYINLHWQYLTELFFDKHSGNAQQILNQASPLFFNLTLQLFYDHILLRIAKLTDNATQGSNKNLSIKNLTSKLPPKTLSQIEDILAKITSNTKGIKMHRNKRIAHNDLDALLSKINLPQIFETEISLAIDGLNELLNVISLEHFEFSRNHRISVPPFCEPSHLLDILKLGVKNHAKE